MPKFTPGQQVTEFKGENAYQSPAFLESAGTEDPLALENFVVIEGALPSYNNWCDVDRLLQTMTHLTAAWKLRFKDVPYIAIGAKHGNPCGAAIKGWPRQTVAWMIEGDIRAIFGGAIMTNFRLDAEVASAMAESMPEQKALFDLVIAPEFEAQAIQVLSRKKGKCRLITNPSLERMQSASLDIAPRYRYVRGGRLVQPNYNFLLDFSDPEMKVYGKAHILFEEDLLLAWGVGCTSNSNTITIANNGMIIGNGVGQQDRVSAAKLAINRATNAGHKDLLKGAVAYSDSFFPFPDGVQVLIDAGIKAIFSTSGSIKDKEVQDLCVENDVTLYQLPDSKARGFFEH